MAIPANNEMNLFCCFVKPESFGEKNAKLLIYGGRYRKSQISYAGHPGDISQISHISYADLYV